MCLTTIQDTEKYVYMANLQINCYLNWVSKKCTNIEEAYV